MTTVGFLINAQRSHRLQIYGSIVVNYDRRAARDVEIISTVDKPIVTVSVTTTTPLPPPTGSDVSPTSHHSTTASHDPTTAEHSSTTKRTTTTTMAVTPKMSKIFGVSLNKLNPY